LRNGRRARPAVRSDRRFVALGEPHEGPLSVAVVRDAAGSGSGGEWRVVMLSDGRTLRVDAEEIARAGLAPGEPVRSDLIMRLMARDDYWRARETAVRLLAARPRSTEELRARFRRDGVADAQAQAVLADLAACGYLDDLAFARAWIESRLGRNPCGSARLRGELRQRGVALAVIEQAIREAYGEEGTSVGEERDAAAVVARRSRAYASLPPEARARRLARFLERRGFAPGTIVRALGTMSRRRTEHADE